MKIMAMAIIIMANNNVWKCLNNKMVIMIMW
jgi:hypothetical protein